MRPAKIFSHAVCALTVSAVAIVAGQASAQSVATDAQGNVLPGAGASYPHAAGLASATIPLYDNSLFPRGHATKVGCEGGRGGVSGQPHVVSVFPAEGAVVRPGIVVVRVTYDRPMSCDASFGGSSDLPNPCPGRWRDVAISQDGRSFRTVCEVAPSRRYRLVLRSFRSEGNVMAAPYEVNFSTSGTARAGTIQEAIAEDVGGVAAAGG